MNPNKVQARKMVLVSVFLLALISVYRDRQTSSPEGTYRQLWGVGVVGMFLSLLADFLPTIAGPFAGLIVLGSLTNGGERIIANALGLIAVQQTDKPASPPSQGAVNHPDEGTRGPAPPSPSPGGHPDEGTRGR